MRGSVFSFINLFIFSYSFSCVFQFKVLSEVTPPLGFNDGLSDQRIVRRALLDLDLPIYDGCVFFRDLLLSLASRQIGVKAEKITADTEDIVAVHEVNHAWNKSFTPRQAGRELFTLSQILAALTIQRIWRMRSDAARSLRKMHRSRTIAAKAFGRKSISDKVRNSLR